MEDSVTGRYWERSYRLYVLVFVLVGRSDLELNSTSEQPKKKKLGYPYHCIF